MKIPIDVYSFRVQNGKSITETSVDVGSGLKGRLSTETPGKTPEPACGLLEEEEDAQHPILSSKII